MLLIKNLEDNFCFVRVICLIKVYLYKDDGVEGKCYYKNFGNNLNVFIWCVKFFYK